MENLFSHSSDVCLLKKKKRYLSPTLPIGDNNQYFFFLIEKEKPLIQKHQCGQT